jgi:hypothetical protein
VKYRTTSDANEGNVRVMTPHAAPKRKDDNVRSAKENDRPIPIVVRMSDEMKIVLVDGKATRLMRL